MKDIKAYQKVRESIWSVVNETNRPYRLRTRTRDNDSSERLFTTGSLYRTSMHGCYVSRNIIALRSTPSTEITPNTMVILQLERSICLRHGFVWFCREISTLGKMFRVWQQTKTTFELLFIYYVTNAAHKYIQLQWIEVSHISHKNIGYTV